MEGGGAVTSDCFTEFNNATGREIQVCVCESRAGQYPCNAAYTITPINILIFSLTMANVIRLIGKNYQIN